MTAAALGAAAGAAQNLKADTGDKQIEKLEGVRAIRSDAKEPIAEICTLNQQARSGIALAGFTLNQGHLKLSPKLKQKKLKLFLAWPTGTGHVLSRVESEKETMVLDVKTGELKLRRLDLETKKKSPARIQVLMDGEAITGWKPPTDSSDFHVMVDFKSPIRVEAGHTLEVVVG